MYIISFVAYGATIFRLIPRPRVRVLCILTPDKYSNCNGFFRPVARSIGKHVPIHALSSKPYARAGVSLSGAR
jgi:hypothetical protein